MIAAATAATGCIEDGFETSPSAQPAFSTDTLKLGEQFAEEPSPTFAMKIYNRHGKQLNLQSVRMRSGKHFRINVDGMSGTAFANVEIRPNDSIYVFVETTLPSTGLIGPQDVTDYIDVVTNGVSRSVVVTAQSTDVVRLKRAASHIRHPVSEPRRHTDHRAGRPAALSRQGRNGGARHLAQLRHRGSSGDHARRPHRLRCGRHIV